MQGAEESLQSLTRKPFCLNNMGLSVPVKPLAALSLSVLFQHLLSFPYWVPLLRSICCSCEILSHNSLDVSLGWTVTGSHPACAEAMKSSPRSQGNADKMPDHQPTPTTISCIQLFLGEDASF